MAKKSFNHNKKGGDFRNLQQEMAVGFDRMVVAVENLAEGLAKGQTNIVNELQKGNKPPKPPKPPKPTKPPKSDDSTKTQKLWKQIQKNLGQFGKVGGTFGKGFAKEMTRGGTKWDIGGAGENLGNCIMGIEEGGSDGGTVKKCTDKFDFDDSRDYCICGAGSEKFPASPPASLLADVEMSCNTLCGTSGCIMGIDDGGDVRRCSAKFRFEKKEVDDYCICGKDSAEVIPGTCNDICGARGKTCVNGMDDEDTLKKCNVGFGFEVDSGTELDDYCICGDEDKITPKTCEDFCYPAGCIMGIDDGGQEEMCGAMFGFEGASTPKRDYLKQLGVENGCEVGKACICLCK